MMLSKSLVFIFAAFTAVSGVAAAPPVQGSGNNGSGNNGGHAAVSSAAGAAHGSGNNGDGNNGGYAAPPNPTTVNSCDGGSIVCCDVFTTGTDAGSAASSQLGSLPLTTYVGLTCTSIVDNQCNTHPLCCKKVDQGIGLQCEPIKL
ncbi:hypothetical protein BJV74DRAFT_885024 [Russula compacta]|nr:hypothetical protein BJV74DRAFT_890198 [Russula compacta]KAH9990667.1 hypothetical protein BJV74DRAFT_885024 [Russula compacta]